MLKIGNKVLKINDRWLKGPDIDPLNPLGLPPYTLRLKFRDTYDPTSRSGTWRQVSSSPNVWDWTNESSNWCGSFAGESYLLEVLGGNTTGVTTMGNMVGGGMFGGCSSLTTVPLFDTSNVTNMQQMFSNCSSLTTVPLYDTSNVTNMQQMFDGCSSLTTVPLFNTSNVTNIGRMFYNCSSLTTVPLFNTSKVITISVNDIGLFENCSSLTSVPLFDTSNVTDFQRMFRGCTSLTTVPLFNTSKASSLNHMLRNCTSLTSIPLFDTSYVTTMNYAFNGCTNVQNGALALYNQASTQSYPPSNHNRTFTNCGSNTTTGAAELAQIPSDWK